MLVLTLCGVTVAITVAMILISRRVTDNGALATMARLIGGQVDHGAARATGTLAGHAVTVENFTNETTHWTEVTAPVPDATVDLDLRPRTDAEDRAIAAGQAIDVAIDDADVRARYVVEGAPAAQVRALLSAEVRDPLLALPPVRIRIRAGALTVISPTLVRDDAAATALIALTGALLSGLTPAATDDAERARLDDARARRSAHDRRNGLIVLGILALIAIAIGIAVFRRTGGPTG